MSPITKTLCNHGRFGRNEMKISFREKHLFMVAIKITGELLINYCKIKQLHVIKSEFYCQHEYPLYFIIERKRRTLKL